MNQQTLISHFLKGAGLADNDSDDTVAIGLTTPIYCPEGVKHVMKEHCAFVDKLLAVVGTKSKDFDRLLSIRGFTHAEWLDLFNLRITEDDFIRHHIFSCLSIETEQQRRRIILRLSPESDEDYVRSLVHVQSFHAYAMKHFFWWTWLTARINIKGNHISITGRTGSGKSKLLELMFYEQQKKSQRSKSCAMIMLDVHGDTARTVLRYAHNNGDRKRIVYVSSSINREMNTEGLSACINPFEVHHNGSIEMVNTYAQELADAIAECLESGNTQITVQMSVLLKPAIFTTILSDSASLDTFARFYLDKDGANADLLELGRNSPVPLYRQFFREDWNSFEYAVTKRSIRTKLLYFLADPSLTALLCGRSTIHLEQCLNDGKVIVFCLPKSTGKHTSLVFARLMIAYIHAITMRRSEKPNTKFHRKPVYLYLDEYQNFATRSLIDSLAESRKWGLHVILSTQSTASLELNLKRLVNVNCGIKMCSLTGAEDRASIAKELDVPVEKVQQLKPMHFLMRKLDGKHKAIKFRVPILSSWHYMTEAERQKLMQYIAYDSGMYKTVSPAPPLQTPISKSFAPEKAATKKTAKAKKTDTHTPTDPFADITTPFNS